MRTFAQGLKASRQTPSAGPAESSPVHSERSRKAGSILDLLPGEREAAWTGRASPRFGYSFSKIPLHPPAVGPIQTKLAHELTHVVQQEGTGTSSLQRKDDDPKNAPKGSPESAPKGPPEGAPKAAATGSCGGKSLANLVTETDKRLGGASVVATLEPDDFGNTSKLGADFKFSACKVGATWRFQLDALVVPIASKVQAATFRKNIGSASDAEVTKESFPDIVRDLSPTRTVTFSVSCAGKSFKDKVTTYSPRKTYWNQELVIKHEAFHRTNWVEMYKQELVKAESDVWAHSIPESDAKDAAGAVAKANPELTRYMTDAYQRLCDVFTPKKESRAYDAGAPAYQKLVDEINERARKEKWA